MRDEPKNDVNRILRECVRDSWIEGLVILAFVVVMWWMCR